MAQSKLKFDQNNLGRNHRELAVHFVAAFRSGPAGKVLLPLLGISGLATLGWGVYNNFFKRSTRSRSEKSSGPSDQKSADGGKIEKEKRVGLVRQLHDILRIAFPTVFSETTGWLTLFTTLLLTRILLTIKIAKITGRLGRLIGAREFDEMFRLQAVFGLVCIPAAIVNSLLSYSSNKLSLSIREKLMTYIHQHYFSKLVFYRISNMSTGTLRMEDFDQRATQDLKKFTSQVSELYGNLLKPFFELILLSNSLGKLMGGSHLAAFFAYFLVSAQFLRFIMPPFARLTAEGAKLEGEFRSHHMRVIQRAEEIAFYGGSEREKQIVAGSFGNIAKLSNRHYFMQLLMGVIDSYLVKYGASMTAYTMLIPAVYLGLYGLKNKSTSEVMEYYLTSTQLFVALGQACKNLVLSYKRIQSLSGHTVRVHELFTMIKKREADEDIAQIKAACRRSAEEQQLPPRPPPRVTEGDDIAFDDVDLYSPTGNLLVRGLNFKVQRNTNVLISGPNGSGKSSLFRVLAGLWPLMAGTMVKPPKDKLFYIPQQPYMAPGSLRDQITYPLSFAGLRTQAVDKRLAELMELVELSYLVDREGGWDAVRDWADVLSGGEKQRVAMARLFYHKPAFGILDECTSAVSVDVEAKIYQTCSRLNITIFTVSHRPQLRSHHDFNLRFDGEGGWTFEDLHENRIISQSAKP